MIRASPRAVWFELVSPPRRRISAPPPSGPGRSREPPLLALSQPEFADAVRRAVRNLHDHAALARNPLVRCPVVADRSGTPDGPADLIGETVGRWRARSEASGSHGHSMRAYLQPGGVGAATHARCATPRRIAPRGLAGAQAGGQADGPRAGERSMSEHRVDGSEETRLGTLVLAAVVNRAPAAGSAPVRSENAPSRVPRATWSNKGEPWGNADQVVRQDKAQLVQPQSVGVVASVECSAGYSALRYARVAFALHVDPTTRAFASRATSTSGGRRRERGSWRGSPVGREGGDNPQERQRLARIAPVPVGGLTAVDGSVSARRSTGASVEIASGAAARRTSWQLRL